MTSSVRRLSIVRGGAPGNQRPTGRAARELPTDYWSDHPEYGLTPQAMVSIFREAEAGEPRRQCDLIDGVVETDCHLRNLFDQRNLAVAGKPWVIGTDGSSDEDKLAAAVLQTALRRLPMDEVWSHQQTHVKYGWAASEIDWDIVQLDGRDWIVPVWFANVPPRRFKIGKDNQLRLVTRDGVDRSGRNEGEPLIPGKWFVTRLGGPLARSGLARTALWPAKFKRDTFADWYIYAQKYGLPLTIVKYTLDADEESKDVGIKILRDLSEDGGAMIPKEFDVDIHGEGRIGDSTGTHGGLISACNREMSKAVNGSTLSNDNGDAGGASYALGNTHDAVRFENVMSDAERVQGAFRVQVGAPFVAFNGLTAVPPILAFQVQRDPSPQVFLANADTAVNKLRCRVSTTQLRQVTGLREPLDDEDALEPAPTPEPAAPGAAPAPGATP